MLKSESLTNIKAKRKLSLSSFVLLHARHIMNLYNKLLCMLAVNVDIINCCMFNILLQIM